MQRATATADTQPHLCKRLCLCRCYMQLGFHLMPAGTAAGSQAQQGSGFSLWVHCPVDSRCFSVAARPLPVNVATTKAGAHRNGVFQQHADALGASQTRDGCLSPLESSCLHPATATGKHGCLVGQQQWCSPAACTSPEAATAAAEKSNQVAGVTGGCLATFHVS